MDLISQLAMIKRTPKTRNNDNLYILRERERKNRQFKRKQTELAPSPFCEGHGDLKFYQTKPGCKNL